MSSQDHHKMLSEPEVTCPRCESGDFRLSRWLSHGEKAGNAGMHPYRCNECRHRFMAPDVRKRRSPMLGTPVVAVAAVVIIAALLALLLSADSGDEKEAAAAREAQWQDSNYYAPLRSNPLAGVPRDKKQLDELLAGLRERAGKGDTAAMTRLGVMHKHGVGMLQNFSLAASWIQQAAYGGNAEGMLELGRLYREGVGVAEDPILAYVWFNRAAAAMNVNAVKERDSMVRQLTPEQLEAAQELSAAEKQEVVAGTPAPSG